MLSPPLSPILPWSVAARLVVLAAALLLLLLLVPTAAAAHARWGWPARGHVVGRFHFDPSRRFARGQRRGIVVAARPGAAVRAACAGPVTFSGRVGWSGLVVSQACGRVNATYLRLGASSARRGRWLSRGTELGTVGPTRRYGLGARRRSSRDGYLDPLTLLAGEPVVAPRTVTPKVRVSPMPAPLPEPMRPAPSPLRSPPLRPATPNVPASAPNDAPMLARPPASAVGLPLGLWWLPTGLALLGAATIIGLARHVSRPSRGRSRPLPNARVAAPPTTESRPT